MFWAYVRIIRRAGYSGWWILIGVVPLVNVVMFLVFAFKEWPIQRELAQLRAMTGQGGYRSGPPAVTGGYPRPSPVATRRPSPVAIRRRTTATGPAPAVPGRMSSRASSPGGYRPAVETTR